MKKKSSASVVKKKNKVSWIVLLPAINLETSLPDFQNWTEKKILIHPWNYKWKKKNQSENEKKPLRNGPTVVKCILDCCNIAVFFA